jgi:hypothetical protein
MEIWGQHELDSGIFLRGSSSALAEAGLYEVQISTKREERCNTGTIFLIPPRKLGEGLGVGAQVLNPPHKPAEWFNLDIIVRGNSITTMVNGTKTGTYSDERRLFHEGVIGLQHPGDQQIQFRQILIRELKGTGR